MGDRIEDRIRLLLNSATATTRFRTTPIPTSGVNSNQSGSVKPNTHLLAEALATASTCECEETLPSASTSTIQRKPGGSIFDCNICFSLSKDPVLTCCGHLFCWPCFYCLPYTDSYSSKECPVCQSQVLHTDITPIYGAASSTDPESSISPVKIPPRPPACRIQSVHPPPAPPNQRFNPMFPRPWHNQYTSPLMNTVYFSWWDDPSTDTATSTTSSDTATTSSTSTDAASTDGATSTTSTDISSSSINSEGDMGSGNSISDAGSDLEMDSGMHFL